MQHAVSERSKRHPLSAQRLPSAEDLLEATARVGPNRPSTLSPGAFRALQATAGNRAVSRMMTGPTPAVQRCGPGDCSHCGSGEKDSAEETATAEQGIEGIVDEPLLASQPVVQRAAPYTAGTVNATNNLAQCLVDGVPIGVTNAVLNGTVLRTGADVTTAMVKPTVTTTAVASGGFEAQVDTVPTNTGR